MEEDNDCKGCADCEYEDKSVCCGEPIIDGECTWCGKEAVNACDVCDFKNL
jgi:hypothetical protein